MIRRSLVNSAGKTEPNLRPRLQSGTGAVVLLAACAVIAVCAAAVAAYFARKYYTQWSEVRLMPIDAARYAAANRALGESAAPRIVFIGDSRVERWRPKPVLPGAEIVWRGIGGETTAQMRYRFRSDALDLGAGAVIIQSGINDLVAGVVARRPQEAMDAALANLLSMATTAANAGSEVYVLTIVRPARPSLLRSPVWADAIYDLVTDINSSLRGWKIDKVHVIDADRLLSADARVLPKMYAADTLHFSAAGYAVLNQELAQRLGALHAVQ